MDLIYSIILKIFTPVIDFLKSQGLWEYAKTGYVFIKGIIIKLANLVGFNWVGNIKTKDVLEFLAKAIKLIIKLFITLFHVIISIVGWIMSIFK